MTMDPLTLAASASRPFWVAWQIEDQPDGRTTKLPYAPDGRRARANAPVKWGDRAPAEMLACRAAEMRRIAQ